MASSYPEQLAEAIRQFLPSHLFCRLPVPDRVDWTPQRLTWVSLLLAWDEGQTLAALPQVLDVLARKHLRPVTVPELMAADPPSPAQLEAGPTGCGLHPAEPGA